MEEYDTDPVLGPITIARANEINFSVAGRQSWFLFSFGDSVVYDLRALEDMRGFSATHSPFPVGNGTSGVTMDFDLRTLQCS